MKKLTFILLLAFVNSCFAGSFLAHTQSWHTGSGFNNQNYGLGYCTDNNYCLGSYKNSYNRHTTYAIKDFYAQDILGIVAGVANGYNHKNPNKYQFIGALAINTKIDESFSTKLLIQPAVKSNDASVFHLIIKYEFK